MKKFILSFLALGIATTLMAIPAKRSKRTITLQDGSRVEATFTGDEFIHYYVTQDGQRFSKQADGTFAPLPEEMVQKAQARRAAANQRRMSRSKVGPQKASWGATSNPISGKKKGLVLLVNFSDVKLSNTQEEFNDYFNKVGYGNAGMVGSVHDYFYTSSYGQFDLTFDVLGPYTVSQKMEYYGGNNSAGNDKHAAQMVCEAVRLAEKDGVDFRQYDWDGDGEVDQVFVIYAGYSEAREDADPNTIWPHEWELRSAKQTGDGEGAITINGVTVNTYAVSNELRGLTGGVIDGIGTACHEFSHCMAIPDFYDTTNRNFGMDAWSLMDYGSYNGPTDCGESPWTYTSYERMYCGWLTPKELKEGTTIKDMKSLYTDPEAYIIYNPSNGNDFYLLENRQLKGFDQYGYGHGMMVLHVQFDRNAWMNNSVNSTSNQRMTIVPADGTLDISYADMAGDPYPGTKKTTQFSLLSKPFEGVTENSTTGTVSFVFDGGTALDTPEPETTATTATGFTVRWPAVEDATHYQVRLIANDGQGVDIDEARLLQEDFAKFNNGATTDGTQDISGSLDKYTQTSGWTGSKVFTSNKNQAKMGSLKVGDKLTTPALASATGKATVSVTLASYGNDVTSITIKTDDKELASFTPTSTHATYVYTGSVNADFKVTVAGNKRFYLSEVAVYDGEFLAEDLAAKAPMKSKKITVFDTDDTSYTFTNLDPSLAYSYQVSAVCETAKSAWSAPVEVELAGSTGISDISVQTPLEKAAIYDLSGRRVTNPGKGIYIQNGKKVVKYDHQ